MQSNLQEPFDIVIIGKGIAGLSAAAEASKHGANVALIYDNAISSTTLAYEGVFRLTNDGKELKSKVESVSCNLENSDLLASFTETYQHTDRKEIIDIFKLVNASPIGKKHRLGGAGIISDLELSCISNQVRIINGSVIKICTSDETVSAVQCFCFPKLITLATKSVVIASGGGIGCLYHSTNNAASSYIPGPMLALSTGAKIRDMEFISFHPFGVIDHYTYHGTTPIFTFFNIGVRSEIYSIKTNRRIEFIEDFISSRTNDKNAHDNIYKIALEVWKNNGVYFFHGPKGKQRRIELNVVAHSLIGGIDINENYETCIKGLYAIGESAGGLHGAGRMPGMALLEGYISGKKAGLSASTYANTTKLNTLDKSTLIPESTHFGMFSDAINNIRTISDQSIFIERSEHKLLAAKQQIRILLNDINKKHISQYIEYGIAEMALSIIESSLMRKETRGFFTRTDYQDLDAEMGRSILINKNPSTSELELSWK